MINQLTVSAAIFNQIPAFPMITHSEVGSRNSNENKKILRPVIFARL